MRHEGGGLGRVFKKMVETGGFEVYFVIFVLAFVCLAEVRTSQSLIRNVLAVSVMNGLVYMKNWLICIVSLLTGVAVSAQEALWGGGELVSPEIQPDNRVTIRVTAPEARKVEVTGDFLPVRQIETPYGKTEAPGLAPLTRLANGVWEYTTPAPLAPELYSYTLLIDGCKTIDPNNVHVARDVASVFNIFLIEGGRADLYKVNDVPHGTVSRVWYHSQTLGKDRRMTVYTPAGYENSGRKYPVFYLLHGMGGDEEAWVTLGRAAQILDNLIAEGLAEPMIVVMPNGNVAMEAAPGETSDGLIRPTMQLPHTMDGEMERHFPDVVEYVDAHYRTIRRMESRAIAGLSMGGFHSLHISKQYPTLFGYVGLFSAAILPRDEASSPIYADMETKLATQFSVTPRLYWMGIGKTDFLYEANADFRQMLDEKGYTYIYYESDGGHTWRNWRIYLTEFVPLLFR